MSKNKLISAAITLIIIGSGSFIWVKQFVCIPIVGCLWQWEDINLHFRKREIELIEGSSIITVGIGLASLTAGLIKTE